MRLYEHEAKRLLAASGIPVPRRYGVIASADEARALALSGPAMVKAQVLTGGRGKAGGIVRVNTKSELRAAAQRLIGAKISGFLVEQLLVEEAVEATAALYIGITLNPATGKTMIMASAEGGINIENAAAAKPGALLRVELEDGAPEKETIVKVVRFLAKRFSVTTLKNNLALLIAALIAAYDKHDCSLLEINPLLVTDQGCIAADAKILLDNNSLYRQAPLLESLGITGRRHENAEATAREKRAAAAGFAYVDLLPEDARRERSKVYIGLAPGGAGYGIFSIDEVTNIGNDVRKNTFVPLNFMDSGGGPTRATVAAMFSLLFDHPLVDLLITSRFGGISSCDIFIRGLVDCLRERRENGQRVVPVYGRMVGTDLAAARRYLESAQRESPEALAQLHMQVGNDRIMAAVIRDALTHFLAESKRK